MPCVLTRCECVAVLVFLIDFYDEIVIALV